MFIVMVTVPSFKLVLPVIKATKTKAASFFLFYSLPFPSPVVLGDMGTTLAFLCLKCGSDDFGAWSNSKYCGAIWDWCI